jgi:hypothetical protein
MPFIYPSESESEEPRRAARKPWSTSDPTQVCWLDQGAGMTSDGLRTSQYWCDRAEEARAMAGQMRNGDTESAMLEVAYMYDRTSERAAKREA